MPFQIKHIKYVIAALLVFCLLWLGNLFIQGSAGALSLNEFMSLAEQSQIDQIIMGENQNYLQVRLSETGKLFKVPNPQTDDLYATLLSYDIPMVYENTQAGLSIGPLIIAALFAGAGMLLFQKNQNGKGSFNQNTASTRKGRNKNDSSLLMLEDVAGNTEAKAMVTDMISFIRDPDKYVSVGARMPRGMLFYGPPGTGKTLMAKAIAGEAGVPFFACSGSDFMQTYVGVGASRVRELFQTAKKSEKAVIFIDEIDAIGKKRSKQPGASHDERDQTLNALLSEMSGFHERDGVVVIAATNRLDTLDDALTRPGRFDRLVEIGLPDINARKKILNLHALKRPLKEDVDIEALAKSTVTFSGAMLENLLNEAAIFAANENQTAIGQAQIDKAFFTVLAGAEKSDTSFISKQDRKITAYHEASHALMTRLLLPDSFISKVTIIPSTRGAGGFSLSIPKDTLYMTRQKMLANMKVLLAGRAGEELIFGKDEITTGAGNDIEKVSRHMAEYISAYGMDEEFGIFNSSGLQSVPDADLLNLCRERLKTLYRETKEQLSANMDSLHAVASALLEKESLNHEDISQLMAS